MSQQPRWSRVGVGGCPSRKKKKRPLDPLHHLLVHLTPRYCSTHACADVCTLHAPTHSRDAHAAVNTCLPIFQTSVMQHRHHHVPRHTPYT